jgi:tetratricopeptide (TPR) repeat protein
MSDKSAIIKEAQKYLARGQIDKAIAEWEKLVKEYPDGTTYNAIGDIYVKKGDKTSAVDSFHKAANFFRQEGFSLKALALYKKILNINPTEAEALFSLGELNEEKGLITDAIKYYLATADSLSKVDKKEKLLDIYAKILTLSPDNIHLRNKVAEIYSKEGLMSEAAKQYFQIAMLYFDKGDTENSRGYYQKVLDVQPLNKEAILGISYLYERSGNLERALEQVKEAANLFTEDTDIHLRSAEIYIMAGRFDEAGATLRKVLEVEAANIKARRLLGDMYLKEGDRDKAWTEYLPVLDEMILDEKYGDAIELLESFKDMDPLETGKRLVSIYRQLGEQVQAANELVSLGDVFIAKGMQKAALNCYSEALVIIPDNDSLKSKVVELEKEVRAEYISLSGEKAVDGAIVEADIYLQYGLYENVRNLLEPFKQSEPGNLDLHVKLKSLYVNTGDKKQAITECLILNELYEKAGDIAKSKQIIKEAHKIYPEDPRLVGLLKEEEVAVTLPEGPAIKDYGEEIAEADLYSRQGLIDEAREILERLQNLFPENEEISVKLASLGQIKESEEKIEHVEEKQKEPVVTEGEILEAEEITEPALESDVMDIFNEFKKGLEEKLGKEDCETHYNLGLAYKDMGLTDDAIREFQISRDNPKRFIPSSNMIGMCYMEKGLYPLAIDVLKDAIDKMEDTGESYWAMKYDLAEAYEKNENFKKALDLYTEVYEWNSKFRSVSYKINSLRAMVKEEDVGQKKPRSRKDRVSYI